MARTPVRIPQRREILAKTSEQILSSRRIGVGQLLVVAVVLVALMIDGLDLQSISYAAPVMLAEWGVTKAEFSLAIAAAMAGMAIGTILGGFLGDRVGRRRIIVFSAVIFGMATIAMGFMTDVGPLAVLRLIGGIGFGAMTPNAYALVAEVLPRRAHPRAIGVLSVGTPLGGVFGGTLALMVLPALGWTWMFFVSGVLALLIALVALIALPESPSFLLARGGHSKATAALNRLLKGEHIAEGTLGASYSTENIGASRQVFRRANLRVNIGAGLGFFTITAVIIAITSWLPTILAGSGLSLQAATVCTLTFSFCNMLGALVHAFVINRMGSRAGIAASSLLTVLLIAVLPVSISAAASTPSQYGLLVAHAALCGLASGVVITSFYTVSSNAFDPQCRSTGMGIALSFGRVGAVTTIIGSGVLLTLTQNNNVAFFGLLAFIVVLTGTCSFVIDRHLPRGVARADSMKGQPLEKADIH